MTKNGLCRGCKLARKYPRRGLRVKAAKRWTEGENEVLLVRYKMTQREAVDRSVAFLAQMEQYFMRKEIYRYGLDNPYMALHARRTVMNQVWRMQIAHGRKRPVASERGAAQTRKVAA